MSPEDGTVIKEPDMEKSVCSIPLLREGRGGKD
jgi:hypothetical protein